MIRKALIALAAAATIAASMTSLSTTASSHIILRFGSGHHYGWHHGYGPHCITRHVRVWHHRHWVWKNVHQCPIFYRGF